MGTDIHGRLQYRYSPESRYADAGPIESGRNYRVFAMLAGVRNGFGFAGVKTHEPLVPISPQRGLPADLEVHDEYIELTKYNKDDEEVKYHFWLGDHSHSWLTLLEIIAWDGWHKPLAMTGVLTAEEFRRIEREDGTPNEWSGVSGPNIIIVMPEQARTGIPHSHVQYDWQVPFRSEARCFAAWIDYLQLKYGLSKNDPAAVRLVFGFDS